MSFSSGVTPAAQLVGSTNPLVIGILAGPYTPSTSFSVLLSKAQLLSARDLPRVSDLQVLLVLRNSNNLHNRSRIFYINRIHRGVVQPELQALLWPNLSTKISYCNTDIIFKNRLQWDSNPVPELQIPWGVPTFQLRYVATPLITNCLIMIVCTFVYTKSTLTTYGNVTKLFIYICMYIKNCFKL